MKKTYLMKGSLLVLVLSLVFGLTAIGAVNAATVYVDHNNAGVEDGTVDNPFNTIQEGIGAANLGDTVKVSQGTYTGGLTINGKNIKLLGNDPATTTIQGTGSVILINGVFSSGFNQVEISGFTITGGANYGILMQSDTAQVIIHNNIIISNNEGIYANSNVNVIIYNNIISRNSTIGIQANYSYCNRNPTVTIYNNIIMENGTYGILRACGTVSSSYNNVWANVSGQNSGSIIKIGNISGNPLFLSGTDYHLSAGSPSIDVGRPIAADNDPDGTRNDQGVYGGPFAASFWPSPAGGPVVTDLQVTPPSVPSGGTITIRATGEIR